MPRLRSPLGAVVNVSDEKGVSAVGVRSGGGEEGGLRRGDS